MLTARDATPGGTRRRRGSPACSQLRLALLGGLAALLVLLSASTASARPGAPPPREDQAYDEKGRPIEQPATEEEPAPPKKLVEGQFTRPKPLNYVAPEYPAEAREAGIEGEVILKLTIDEDGKVAGAEVQQAGGHGFDEAALAAADKLKFSPARDAKGNPFAARILYRYGFSLQPEQPEQPDPGAPAPSEAAPTFGVLSGTVLIQPVDEPLVGASVTLTEPSGQTQSAVADAEGVFRFVDLPAGRYSVQIEAAGYEAVVASEEVVVGEETLVTYRVLAQTAGGALEVIVEGERPAREVTRRTLEKREIERIPGTSGDALRSIESLPGVARPFGGIAGVLLVRGSGPFDTQVFFDGINVPLIYHFGGLSSVVPTELLSKIDFYPGNFSARYGRVTGGIVDAGMRSPRSDGYHGLVQADLIDLRLMLEGPVPLLEGWTFAAAGRRSWFDAWLGPVLEAAGAGVTQAPRYYDYQFLLENKPDDDTRTRISFYGSDDGLELLIEGGQGAQPIASGESGLAMAFWRLQHQYDVKLSSRSELRSVMAMGRDLIDVGFGEFFFFVDAYDFIGRTEFSHQLARSARLNAGLDWIVSVYDVGIRLPSPPPPGQPGGQPFLSRTVLQSSERGFYFQPAGYVEFELTPDSRTRIVPGIRLDYDRDSNQLDVSPRFNARYLIIDEFPTTAIKGGIGFFHQPAQYFQVVEPFGTPGVGSERAIHYGLGLEQEITEQLEVSGEAFFKQLDDLIVAQPSESGTTTRNANTGVGYAVGGEFLAKYKPDERFFGWLAYTISRSMRQNSPDSPEFPVSWDQTHILTVLGSYKIGGGWEVGARFRLVSGNLTTPRVCDFTNEACDPRRLNAVYHASTGAYSSFAFATTNSERLPAFHSLDIRLDRRWTWDWFTLSFYVDIQNVYNQQNVEGISYNYDFTARQYVTGIPILPSLGLRGEF